MLSLDDIPLSSQLPLSASMLNTPQFLFSFTAPEDSDSPATNHLKQQASQLGQQGLACELACDHLRDISKRISA